MTVKSHAAARALLLGSICCTALVISNPAMAQEAPVAPVVTEPSQDGPSVADTSTAVDPPQQGDQEIVVTARRRAESLQNVPIAVTAFSGAQLERQGAVDITDIGQTTPNVTLEVSRGTNSTLTAFIRGVGQQDPVAGFEQGVGLYLDDVYLNRPQAAVLDIYDVERIEVLRGPQGTLYGRNTIGGAIKYVTKRLSDYPELDVKANLGTYKQADLVMKASAPIADGFKLGAGVARLSRGGFGDNLTTGKENYNKDIWALRGTVEAEPGGDTFFRLSGDYTWDYSLPRGGHRLIPSLLTHAPVLNDVFDTRGALETPEQKVKSGGATLLGEIGIADGIKFRSITSYRKDSTFSPIDFDALPTEDLDVASIYKNKQFSQEGQIVFEQGRLNGVAGIYYLNADALTIFDTRVYTTVPGLATHTNAKVGTKTTAIFADASFDITDQFSVSAGGRYTWDKRDGDIFRIFYAGGGSTYFGGLGIPFGTPQTDFEGSRKFKKFTPRASVSFKPTRDHTLYASYSQGFKGGSFDPRGTAVNAPDVNGNGVKDQSEIADFISFDPEQVKSYELGYKGRPFLGVDVALALFQADYTDVQIPGSAPCTVAGVNTFCGVTANAGKARFRGVELEANSTLARDFASAGDRVNLSGSLGYLDAKYLEYITNLPVVGPSDVADFRKVQNTPKWTASGTLDYSAPMSGGRLNLNTTLSYRTKTYQFEIPNPYLDQKGFALWDANMQWSSAGGRYTIGLHGRNLLNKEYKTSGYTFLSANPQTGELLVNPTTGNFISGTGKEGTLTAFYGNPRQVWASFGVHF